MNCEELRPEYGAYSLGVAEDPERSEISEHMQRGCPNCLAGVRSAMSTVAAMSGGVKSVDPPKRLRRRVVAMVSPASERKGWAFWFPWAVAAVLAMVLVSVALPGRVSRSGQATTNSARFEEMLAIINDPVTKDVAFGDPAARGRFFVSPGKGVVFIAARLPKLAAGRTFEMWVIPASGKPIPAGTFNALEDSTAVYIRQGPVEGAAAMAISVEPAGGSQQPTTTPIIVSKL
jgi:anti-sigma-K factor RskA